MELDQAGRVFRTGDQGRILVHPRGSMEPGPMGHTEQALLDCLARRADFSYFYLPSIASRRDV